MRALKLFVFATVVAPTSFIDPDYTSILDSVQCNHLFPFAFSTGKQSLQIVDWDLQNFSDNYSRFSTTLLSYATTQESYIAMCYRDVDGLFCGVTYETERSFKWLRKITDAHISSLAAIKISAYLIETTPSTSAAPQPTNDSRVNLVYEPRDDLSIVVFISFNYLTGVVEQVYRINKGISGALANTMILQNIMSAAAMDGNINTSAEFSAISLVMSYDSGYAFEIQFDNTGMANPVPKRILDYRANSGGAPNFQNSDYSKVLGVSAKSRKSLPPPLYQNDIIQNTYTMPSDVTKAFETMYRMNNLYFYWLFSATAFLQVVIGSPTTYTNTVWWYMSRKFQTEQQIAELQYTFVTNGPLTSYVVSPDAPQLCMTVDTGTGTTLYIDDVARAAVQPKHKMFKQTSPPWQFYVDWSQSELGIGLKQYGIAGKSVVCRAINTQLETVSTSQGIPILSTLQVFYPTCYAYTTILLEDKNTGTVHLLQIKFRRARTFNDDDPFFKYWGTENNCIGYPIGWVNFAVSGKSYIQYSYQLPLPVQGLPQLSLFAKAFVNYGFNLALWTPDNNQLPENTASNDQQLSFYVAGMSGSSIFVETNNMNLRCKTLTRDSTLDLVLTDYEPGPYFWAENHSVQSPPSPVNRFKSGTAVSPFQALTPVSSLSAVGSNNYQQITPSTYLSLESVSDPSTALQYDWSVCTQPRTFGLDKKVKKGLLCLQVNTNLTLNPMNTQGANLKYAYGPLSSMDFNMWPYSNCWDRSSNPFYPFNPSILKPSKQLLSSFFLGKVENSGSVLQKYPDTTIQFQLNAGTLPNSNADDFMQIQMLGLAPGTLGLQQTALKMLWKIGADSKSEKWDQNTMFQLSCQPQDFVWQTIQDTRQLPLKATYFYGQGSMQIALPAVIPTNALTKYNIDLGAYLGFSFTVLYTSNTTGPTVTKLASVTIANQALTINQKDGDEQWLMLGASAISVDPYYYINNLNGQVTEDRIKIQLTDLVNVTFVYNIAPNFTEPLKKITLAINDTIEIKLPEIFDPDSDKAYIQYMITFPFAKFVRLVNSRRKTGSTITFNPVRNSESGTYLCMIYLIDVSLTPRTSSYGFQIEVNKTVTSVALIPFVPKNGTTIVFTPDSLLGIKVQKVFSNQTLLLKFNLPMEIYINPLFTENSNRTTNVTTVLKSYLQLSHKQYDVYQKVNHSMPQLSFNAISDDGIYIFLQLEFKDLSRLSQSPTEAIDYILLTFNETQVFVSQSQRISTSPTWHLELKLPIQLSSSGQAVQAAAQTVSRSFSGLMSANFVINIIMSTSLQKMWGNLNVLQLVVATPLLQVNLPQNAFALCEALLSVTQFQLFDSTSLTDRVFGRNNFAPDTLFPLDDRFNAGGFQQINFIYNLGSMFYFAAFILSLYVLAYLLTYIQIAAKSTIIDKFLQKVWGKLTPALPIRMFFEINFELGVCCYIHIKYLTHVVSWVDIFSSVLALSGAALCFLVPVRTAYILYNLKTQKLLHRRKSIQKFGALYQLQLVKNPTYTQLFYNVFFMIRRLATLLCIFNMQRVPSFQIGCMMYMTTFWMGYSLSTRPFEDPALNKLEAINELFYNLFLFLCFTFTELLPDVGTRTGTGYIFIALLLIMLAINIGVQIKDTVKLIILRLKRFWMLYKLRQQKWRKPSATTYYMPHSKIVKQILHDAYRERMYKDIVGEIKSQFTGSLKTTEQVALSSKPKVTFVNAKIKPSIRKTTKVTHQEQASREVKNSAFRPRNQTDQHLAPSALRSDNLQLSELSDNTLVDQFMQEEEVKQPNNQSRNSLQNREDFNWSFTGPLTRQQRPDLRRNEAIDFERPRHTNWQSRNHQIQQEVDPALRIREAETSYQPEYEMSLQDYHNKLFAEAERDKLLAQVEQMRRQELLNNDPWEQIYKFQNDLRRQNFQH